jgi:hypothetical protein
MLPRCDGDSLVQEMWALNISTNRLGLFPDLYALLLSLNRCPAVSKQVRAVFGVLLLLWIYRWCCGGAADAEAARGRHHDRSGE